MAKQTATLTDNETGKSYDFPIIHGTVGPRLVDIRKMYGESGMFTYDPGFTSTGSCASKITYIDGDEGVLLYRGYNIAELAEQSDFMECCYLLMKGDLPNKVQKDKFVKDITHHTMVHEQISTFYRGFRRDAHPMAVCCGVVGALSAFYHDSLDINDPYQRMVASYRLIAKMPTIAAMAYKYSVGQPFVYPRNDLSYAGNFLRMMFSVPAEEYEIDPELVSIMNLLLILHADHEQNCSTSTVRMVGSSKANLFATISAGICALWGPLHGGANQEVLEMLTAIHTDGGDVKKYVAMAKDKNSTFKLMGFGHRVYKNFDPRATLVKESTDEVLADLGVKDPLLDIAKELEQAALADDYFVERKLYPNVDFYTGVIYKAMGFPTRMFTVLFAIGRLPGWIAQWREANDDPATKIGRPQQLYVGPPERRWPEGR